MVLNASDIEVTSGSVETNRFKTASTNMERHHCAKCGVAIWFSSPEYEGIVALKPGTLDDTSYLQPIAHMWVRSAQPWLNIGDNIPVFQEQPEFSELLELARGENDA